MTKHGRSNADKLQAKRIQQKTEANRHPIVNQMTDPPDRKHPGFQEIGPSKKDNPPTPSEVLVLVGDWLRSRKNAPREKSKAADWTLVVLTIAIAVAAFWSAFIFQGQLEEARKTTRLSVRPWIGLDDELTKAIQNGPLVLDDQGNASLEYRIQTKNFGSVPASNVTAWANLVVSDDLNVVFENKKIVCGDAVIGKKDIGFVVFPGRDRQFSSSISTTKVDIRNGVDRLGNRFIVSAWLVGCIGYRDQFGYLYRSGFWADMVNLNGGHIQWIGPPKGPLRTDGRFVVDSGSIDSGSISKY